jgi:hypothetical protein
MNKRRVYEEIRSLVEDLKGKMHFERAGYQWGAWIIRLNGKQRVIRSNGSGYPELDRLYELKPNANPNDWRSYTDVLRPGAKDQLLELLSQQGNE